MRLAVCLFIALFASCARQNPWEFESILSGEALFDSSRLVYADNASPLRFEIVRLGPTIESFLSLLKFKFSSAQQICVAFQIGEEKWEERLPCLEGKMRIRFSPELTERIIHALQEGREVVMIVDGFEQRLVPDRFIKQFEKLAGSKPIFRNPFKGLFDP